MSLVSQLYNAVQNLTERLNLIENNAKNNAEFSAMDSPIDRSYTIRVFKNGVSKTITPQNLLDESGYMGTKIHFLDLNGVDTTVPELQYIKNAIMRAGAGYTCENGEQIVFKTVVTVRTADIPNNILHRFYRVLPNLTHVGGDEGGTAITETDLMPDGYLEVNLDDNQDLFIDVDDIGVGPVETGFNADTNGPYEIIGEKFIIAIMNGDAGIWRFNGDDAVYGLGAIQTTASNFIDLAGQPDTNPNIESKPTHNNIANNTVIDLSNHEGKTYFMGAAENITSYTYENETLLGNALLKINAPTQPAITGSTQVGGNAFVADTDMYLYVYYNGDRVEHRFIDFSQDISGTSSGLASEKFVFNTTTTGDPTTGKLRFNNATPTSVTNIAISNTTNESILITGIHSNITTDDVIYIQQTDDVTKYLLVKAAFGTSIMASYVNIPCTVLDSGVIIDDGAATIVKVYKKGAAVGSTIPASKTGQTFVFTEDAYYNKVTFLASGNITLDLTGAVVGTTLIAYFDGYIPSFTITNDSNDEEYFIDAGFFSTTKKNIASLMYNGESISIHVTNRVLVTDFITSLVASYNLNSDASDYTTNNDGTATLVTYAAAKVDDGAVFNGTSSYISIPDADDFSMIDGSGDVPFTVSFWMTFPNFTDSGDVISKAELVTGNYEWVIKKATSDLQFFLYSENVISNNLKLAYDASGLATSTLHHFIFEHNGDGTTSGFKLTVNGVDVTGSCVITENGTYVEMTNNGAALLIGKRHDNTKYIETTLDELHIWKDKVFTSDEKVEIYNKENAGISIL